MGKESSNAASEYKNLNKLGFICLEEVDEGESEEILKTYSNTPVEAKNRRQKEKERRLLKRGKFTTELIVTSVEQQESTAQDSELKDNKVQSQLKDKYDLLFESVSSEVDLPNWTQIFPEMHPVIKQCIHSASFTEPSQVQQQVLSSLSTAGRDHDILGCAPTGSGKTLAYLIPILQHLLTDRLKFTNPLTDGPFALIIVPTRELALQIDKHYKQIFPSIWQVYRSMVLVGGMSQEKQERLLAYSPTLLIATPGRLAEILQYSNSSACRLTSLNYLVLDEADRLTEKGHFRDLDSILECLSNAESDKSEGNRRRTFLLSATLDNHTLTALRKKLKLNDRRPIRINVNSQSTSSNSSTANPETLLHYRLNCVDEDEKFMYLAALLNAMKPTDQALIFVNTINLVRRLTHSLKLLSIKGHSISALHAQMLQKQRFKSLERFTATPGSILVTSDVAARGLDIPSVSLVIHYQFPPNVDTFWHRSGRTARARRQGSSITLVTPADSTRLGRLIKETSLCMLDAIPNILSSVGEVEGQWKRSCSLAQKISKLEMGEERERRERTWEEKAADALGIDLEIDIPKSKRFHPDDEGDGASNKKAKLNQLKSQLSQSLQFCHK